MDSEYEDDRYEVLRAERPEVILGRVVPAQGVPLCAPSNKPLTERAADSMKEQIEREIVERLGQGADGGGQRLNAGKNRIELLPPEWLWALADVMTQGSKKYDARNWEKGMDWSSMIGCMHRHIAKFQAGQRYDGPKFDRVAGTTGCHEMAMVAWNALALMVYDLRGIGNNDMPHEDYAQLDLFRRVNAETSDLSERLSQYTTMEPGS
jgi:hypothetical protein